MPDRRSALIVLNPGKFRDDGYAILPSAVDDRTITALIDDLAPLADSSRAGIRHMLRDSPAVRALARLPAVRAVAEAALGPEAVAVRAILFDKTANANWKVAWHQDLTIAVQRRVETPGFGPWSEKDGVTHVQPPAELLADMIAVRIHLDDCAANNGPVRVLPGSHRAGRLSATAIEQWRSTRSAVICTVPRGGIVAFHSLLLHASSPATTPTHRRVVHIEYAAARWRSLPGALAWLDCH
ncbi:MAG: phytanoyl-CoA dioxygenase family protein [Azonexus sp.]|nr:phytanoyl-CoA dioxygenase family protein [Azonexus sp.]